MDYVIATIKPWNVAAFERHRPALPGDWRLITDRFAWSSAARPFTVSASRRG